MKKFDTQAEVVIYGETARRTVYTDGEKLFVKWYGEWVEVKRLNMFYASV